jgi:long-subunit acyl-CoA synthetase (AMP-forming)
LNESGFVTLSVPNRYKGGSVGKPLMRISIDKDKYISICGDNLFSGYYKNKKYTREKIKNGWFRTDERGYIDDDGFLFLIDDDVEKIETQFLENTKLFEYAILHKKNKKNYLLIFPKTIKHNKLTNEFHDIDDNLIKLSDCIKSKYLKQYLDNIIYKINLDLDKKNKISKYIIVSDKITKEDVSSKLNINENKFLELYKDHMK